MTSCLGSSKYESSYPYLADFEYRQGDKEEYFGSDKAYFDNSLQVNIDLVFFTKKVGGDFSGFAWSIAADAEGKEASPFSVYDKHAAGGSEGFFVFHNNPTITLDHHICFPGAKYGTFSPVGCFIHNTTSVAKDILEGPNKFERGDSLKVTATGILNGQPTGSVSIMLADYRQKDSLVTKWTEFKLDKLGPVEYIDFNITSSKPVQQYFCIDNFTGKVSISIK